MIVPEAPLDLLDNCTTGGRQLLVVIITLGGSGLEARYTVIFYNTPDCGYPH